MPRARKPASPFRYFNSSPEVIRLVVLMYVRLPLSLRNVEDLLFERGVEGDVLESYVTKTRDEGASLTFMKKALKRHGSPEPITTDGLRSYGAAMDEVGNREKQEIGRWVEAAILKDRRASCGDWFALD